MNEKAIDDNEPQSSSTTREPCAHPHEVDSASLSSGTKPKGPGSRMLGMKLTEKQQAIWDLFESGKTRPEIAALLSISVSYISHTLMRIRKKLGVKAVPCGQKPLEVTNPEKAAAILDALSEADPYVKISEAFQAAGLPPQVKQALLRRLRVKYNGEITELKALKTAEILELLGKKINLALSYMDDKVMSEASFRDLALGTTAMIEKRQLLRGEPTQIISDNERKKLHELIPSLIAEAQRRGITIEGKVTEKLVEDAK